MRILYFDLNTLGKSHTPDERKHFRVHTFFRLMSPFLGSQSKNSLKIYYISPRERRWYTCVRAHHTSTEAQRPQNIVLTGAYENVYEVAHILHHISVIIRIETPQKQKKLYTQMK